jgi:hypothetical protein
MASEKPGGMRTDPLLQRLLLCAVSEKASPEASFKLEAEYVLIQFLAKVVLI